MTRWTTHLVLLMLAAVPAGLVAVWDLGQSKNAFLHGLIAGLAIAVFVTYAAITSGAVAIFAKAPRGAVLVHAAALAMALAYAGLQFASAAAGVARDRARGPYATPPAPTARAVPTAPTPSPEPAPPPEPPRVAGPSAELLAAAVPSKAADAIGCRTCSLDAIVASAFPPGATVCPLGDTECVLAEARSARPFKGVIPLHGIDSKVTQTFVRTAEGDLLVVFYDSAASGFGGCGQSISVVECVSLRKGENGLECSGHQQWAHCRDNRSR